MSAAFAAAVDEAAEHVFQNVDPNALPAQQQIDFWGQLFGGPQGPQLEDPYQGSYYNSQYPYSDPRSPYYIDPALAAYYMSLNPRV